VERGVLSSSPWDPVQDAWERFRAAPGEIQTGHQEAFLYQEGAQALEQAS